VEAVCKNLPQQVPSTVTLSSIEKGSFRIANIQPGGPHGIGSLVKQAYKFPTKYISRGMIDGEKARNLSLQLEKPLKSFKLIIYANICHHICQLQSLIKYC